MALTSQKTEALSTTDQMGRLWAQLGTMAKLISSCLNIDVLMGGVTVPCLVDTVSQFHLGATIASDLVIGYTLGQLTVLQYHTSVI